MRVWRICKAEHAPRAFSGEGAILYAGRWHHAGTPVIYTSESRALAALEQLVHLHRNRLPPHFVCFAVDVPRGLAPAELRIQDLPRRWRRYPGPPELRDLGTRWAESGESVCLKVPSAVVPGEHNFLLNPRHGDFGKLEIGQPEPFALDPRVLRTK